MISIAGSIITALAVSVFIFPILIKYSQKKQFVDLPSHRRIHKRITPSIGGVAIFVGFLTATVAWLNIFEWPELKSIMAILFMMFVLGLCDDLVHLKPKVKILGQAVAGSLAFFLLDVKLTSTYGLFGDIHFPLLVSYLLTVFFIIILTNSFNLIDGIDGLAGSFSVACLFFYGIWFYFIDDTQYAILCFALAGAAIGFLVFNWEPSRIFMGDTGALLIGIMLCLLTLHFLNTNEKLETLNRFKFKAPISTATAVLILPIVDTVRVIVIRLYHGISPLAADKRHIHHYLIRLGFSHQRAVLLLIYFYALYLAIVVAFRGVGDNFMLPAIIALSVVLCLLLERLTLKKSK